MESRRLEVEQRSEGYALIEAYPDATVRPGQASEDAGYAALLRLCEVIAGRFVRPINVRLGAADPRGSSHYEDLFQCPITYGCEPEVWLFSADDAERPLAASIPEVAGAIDRIGEQYLETLDQGAVAAKVRQLLLKVLPSGKLDQQRISSALHRSTSTLQRQLSAEGTSYREILESTRRILAERYLTNGHHSQAEIAFMIGFTDQANFSRAFKRWTGGSPRQFQQQQERSIYQ